MSDEWVHAIRRMRRGGLKGGRHRGMGTELMGKSQVWWWWWWRGASMGDVRLRGESAWMSRGSARGAQEGLESTRRDSERAAASPLGTQKSGRDEVRRGRTGARWTLSGPREPCARASTACASSWGLSYSCGRWRREAGHVRCGCSSIWLQLKASRGRVEGSSRAEPRAAARAGV